MSLDRISNAFKFVFEAGETESHKPLNLGNGCFGTLIVESGSEAIGKDLQFVATPGRGEAYPETELLEVPKELAEGANAITSDEITQVGAAKSVKLRLDSAVVNETTIWLLWKS